METNTMFAVVAEIFERRGLKDSKIVSVYPTREEAENASQRICDKIRETTTLRSAVKTMMKEWEVRNPPPREGYGDYSAWYETRDIEEARLFRELNVTRFPPEERVTVMEIPMLNPEKAAEAWDSWATRSRESYQ